MSDEIHFASPSPALAADADVDVEVMSETHAISQKKDTKEERMAQEVQTLKNNGIEIRTLTSLVNLGFNKNDKLTSDHVVLKNDRIYVKDDTDIFMQTQKNTRKRSSEQKQYY